MVDKVEIHGPDNYVLATITFSVDSFRRWEVMGENSITLHFSLPQIPNGINEGFLEIPVGSWIDFAQRRYTLFNPSDFKKNGNRDYEYTLKLYAYQELLYDRIFVNEPDGMTVFPRRGRPEDFLRAIVRNMNKFETDSWDRSEWVMGSFIQSDVQQLIQFNGVSCMEALRLIAEAFKTEWEVNHKTIHLRKVEYYKDSPIELSYGKGNGFIPGLGRANYDDNRPVHKLYVKGGDRNIEYSTYGSQTLLLPKNQTIRFDGTYFDDETGYNSTLAREYQTSTDGTYLTRIGVPQTSRREAFIELTEAYPKYIGTITRIVWIYKGVEYNTYSQAYDIAITEPESDTTGVGAIFCDVFDTGIPNDMDFSAKDANGKTKYRIDGEQFILCPQTGRLSGVELAIQQDQDTVTGYIHSERRFKLLTDSYYGGFIPDNRLQVGDTYAVFGFRFTGDLASEYIAKGERDLFKEAVRYKYENEDLRFTFKGDLDGIYAQNNWNTIGYKVVAGGYVKFSDPHFHPDGTLIRISAIKEFLYEPYKPNLELTNIVIGGGLRGELSEIPQQEIVINEQDRQQRRLEQRRWRDVQELRKEIGNVFSEFSEAINPVSVQSMQIIAGSVRGQFRFVTSTNTNTVAQNAPVIYFDSVNNSVQVSGNSRGTNAYIQHLTLGITNLDGKSVYGDNGTTIRPASEYRYWSVPSRIVSNLDRTKLYWVYVRCNKSGTGAQFEITTDIHSQFDDGTYYWLVVGALNSEYEGSRGWSPLWGFTEILPGQITTPMLRSNDGRTYFDLVNGIIGGDIRFISTDGSEKPINGLENEINSKVQTYYQTNDPSASWTTPAIRLSHVGDLWYNPDTKITRRYNDNATSWEILTQEEANKVWADNGTSTTRPTPPYKVGDVWFRSALYATATYPQGAYVCQQARASGSFNEIDWSFRSGFDDTQTRINGGVVTTGSLRVGSGTMGTVNAGITGDGTLGSSVRFWAGQNFANRSVAPFRVQQDGTMYATNAYVTGDITATRITANSGDIAGFSLSPDHIGGPNSSTSYGLSLWNDNIILRNPSYNKTAIMSVARGNSCGYFAANDTTSNDSAIYATAKSNIGQATAINIGEGCIMGLNYKFRQVTTSTTLSIDDTYIYCNNTSAISIYLPSTPSTLMGKVIFIRRSKTANVTVYGTIDNGISGSATSVSVGHGTGDLGMFIWSGSTWIYNIMDRQS